MTIASSCPACGTTLRPQLAFCEQCGARTDGVATPAVPTAPTAAVAVKPPLRKPSPAIAALARKRAAASRIRTIDSERKAVRSARICMSIVAILLFVVAGLGWSALGGGDGETGPLRALLVANGLLGVVFLALVVWAGRNAFAAVLTGLVLYLSLQLAAIAMNPLNLVSGIFLKAIIIAVLVGGIRAGLQQRRRRAAAAHAAA